MDERLNQLLSVDRVGRASVRLPAFAGWGTNWQFGGGPDDRTPAARTGVFPVALESDGGGPSEPQVRAVEWLVAEQSAIADRVAAAVADHLRLSAGRQTAAGTPPPPDDGHPMVARAAVLLTGVRVYDPRVDPRYERGGSALVGLGFASEWCGHTADHGIEAVVSRSGVVHVGDSATY